MDILTQIVNRSREITMARAQQVSITQLEQFIAASQHQPISLRQITREKRPHVIAEFKRKSPSKGMIRELADPCETARSYAAGGASAMSVLTEPDYFAGNPEDLRQIRSQVQIPLLRKDFLVTPYQFYEARAMGADLVLLIARCLERSELAEYTALAHELGLEVLCEIHNLDELETVADAPVDFLGVNCRDLKSFHTDLEHLIQIVPELPRHIPLVAESGITNRADLWRLYDHGYQLFLIGEFLMSSASSEAALKDLLTR